MSARDEFANQVHSDFSKDWISFDGAVTALQEYGFSYEDAIEALGLTEEEAEQLEQEETS